MKPERNAFLIRLVLVTFGLLPALARGQITYGDFTFHINSWTGSVPNFLTLDSYIGPGRADPTARCEVVIPDKVNGVQVVEIGPYAFAGCEGVTGVTIPDSLFFIGNNAFDSCWDLRTVIVGRGVSIGVYAFQNTGALTRVYFMGSAPSSVTASAFSYSWPTIYYYSTTAGWGPIFAGRPTVACDLQPYTYVTNSGAITVTKYTGPLGSVTIPDTINGLPVTTLGPTAFLWADGITDVTIGSSLTNMDPSAFLTFCPNLKSITVDPANPVFSSLDGVFFDKGQTTLWQYPRSKADLAYRVPDGVTAIWDSAFLRIASLTTLTIPASVTQLGDGALAECANLTAIYFLGDAPSPCRNGYAWGYTFASDPATLYFWRGASLARFGGDTSGCPVVFLDPPLPRQSNLTVNALTPLTVTNTANVGPWAGQLVTNAFYFTNDSRDALLADGWRFTATRPDGTDRDTEVTDAAQGAMVSYDQASHPGALRIPCDLGDLWQNANNSRNSLFRSLPGNWQRVQLALALAPVADYQQMHFGLYQDDDNYLELGASHNDFKFWGEALTLALETNGSPITLGWISSRATNMCFRLDRNATTGAASGYCSEDGTNWTRLGTNTPAFTNPRLFIWTGGSPSAYVNGGPVMDLRRLDLVISNAVPRTLSYSLLDPPKGATIDTNGIITWSPGAAAVPRTNMITTVLTDNGIPPLYETNSFTVVVKPMAPFPISSVVQSNQVISITWDSVANQTYRLQFKNDLNETNWRDVVPDIVANGPRTVATNPIGTGPARFYRLVLLP